VMLPAQKAIGIVGGRGFPLGRAGKAEKREFTQLVYSPVSMVEGDTANYEPGSASPAVTQTRIPSPRPWGVSMSR